MPRSNTEVVQAYTQGHSIEEGVADWMTGKGLPARVGRLRIREHKRDIAKFRDKDEVVFEHPSGEERNLEVKETTYPYTCMADFKFDPFLVDVVINADQKPDCTIGYLVVSAKLHCGFFVAMDTKPTWKTKPHRGRTRDTPSPHYWCLKAFAIELFMDHRFDPRVFEEVFECKAST